MGLLVEVRTFRLRPGVDEAEFLRADELLQRRLSSGEGFVRRTTARRVDGERAWLDLTLWASAEHADDETVAAARAALDNLVDPESVRVERFRALD